MAGDIKVAVVQAAVNTATGVQTFSTTAFGGGTPKAALFFYAGDATVNGTIVPHKLYGFGACDAAGQWAFANNANDALTTTSCRSRSVSNRCVSLIKTFGGIDGDALFDSFTTNGVTIDWQIAPSKATLLTVVLFGGADLSVDVGKVVLNATTDVKTDVTAPGFTPDAVLFSSANGIMDTVNGGRGVFFGVATWDGATIVQKGIMQQSRSGRSATDVGGSVRSNRIGNVRKAGSFQYEVMASDFDANGFSLRPVISGGQGDGVGYLALKFGTQGSWCAGLNSPTATGNWAQTGPGFKPQFVMLAQSYLKTENTNRVSGEAGAVGLGVFTADAEFCISAADEDGQTTTDAQSLTDSKAVNIKPDDGSTTGDFIGTGPGGSGSLDATGFTVNFSQVNGTIRKWWGFAIEEGAVAGAVPAGSLQMMGLGR